MHEEKKKANAASTSASTKITSYFETKQKIPQTVKRKVTDACVQFVAGDIRPFSAVEGVWFQNLNLFCTRRDTFRLLNKVSSVVLKTSNP